ncbi:hypothetical protein CBER1_10283 [Cercospora berteroae]|uniref:Enoyl reductase (ER) domain-containing protein n=1 Tax=Cercospora berteroae TaxID=357750 RepID=A0A2S6CNA2_9PEZI|nr:hypothetical protein CBER1_10283 [Cercospora berteroae]
MNNEDNFGLIRQNAGQATVQRIPIPEPRDDYILVRTIAIALNLTDHTSLDAAGASGTLAGDRIAGFAHGANDPYPEGGALARYIVVKGDLQLHIPDNVDFEAASSIGVAIGTSMYALHKSLSLPLPGTPSSANGEPLLVYGGSTSTGSIAVQLAAQLGYSVITTCSPKHFDLLQERGAKRIYDYAPSVGESICDATNNQLKLVFDTVSIESSAAICAQAFGSEGGIYCNLLDTVCSREDVSSVSFLGYSMTGEQYVYEGEKIQAQLEDFILGRQYMDIAEKLWAKGQLKMHPQRVGSKGLYGTLEGMQEMRDSKLSGEKLVYRIEDTPWLEADSSSD